MAKYTIEEPGAPAPTPKAAKYTVEEPADAAPARESIADTLLDPLKEAGHQFMESARETQKTLKESKLPDYIPGAEGLIPGTMIPSLPKAQTKLLQSTMGAVAAPVTGALTSMLGRPVETATGGRVKKETVGNVASLALPVAQEAVGAKDVAALAKELGIGRKAAQDLLTRLSAKAAPTGRLAGNVDVLERLGIKPSLAAATSSPKVRQLANTLGQNIITRGPVAGAVKRTMEGVSTAAERAARTTGEPVSPTRAGEIVQEAAQRFSRGASEEARAARDTLSPEAFDALASGVRSGKSRDLGFGHKADILYEDAERKVGHPDAYIPMPNVRAAINDMVHRSTDPSFTGSNVHPAVSDLSTRLEQQIDKMTFRGARLKRSQIRRELLSDPALRHTAPEAEIKSLYDAFTKDLTAGAKSLGGEPAAKAFGQADAYYKTGLDRIESALSSTYGKGATPDKVFADLVRDAQEGRGQDLKRLMQVRRSLPRDEWRDVAASVLDSMGRAKPGMRTEETQSSFRTFLTNFEKMAGDPRHLRPEGQADSGLRVLLSGVGDNSTYKDVQDIAKAASKLKELEKTHNWSQSGAMVGNTIAMLGAGGAAIMGAQGHTELLRDVALLATMGLGTSKVLESPAIVRTLAKLSRDETISATESAALADYFRKAVPAGAAARQTTDANN